MGKNISEAASEWESENSSRSFALEMNSHRGQFTLNDEVLRVLDQEVADVQAEVLKAERSYRVEVIQTKLRDFLSVPKFTATMYCICLSIPQIYT